MDSSQYKIFERQNLALIRSLIIHSTDVANAINGSLTEIGHGVHLNKCEWKYYLNLAGRYHETDPDITVVSNDTLTPVRFDVETLEAHPVTKRNYQIGKPAHKELINKYPEQEMLIRGIVSPVDIDRALSAEEFEILSYDNTLVESNEHSLIHSLQQYINNFYLNGQVKGYLLSDNLFMPAVLAVLYQSLATVVMVERLKRCHTDEAHSFHIWAYLSGYGGLDRWRQHIDSFQTNYLYRNMRWINRNVGASNVFEDLTTVLMTRKNLPLYGYDLRHDLAKLKDTLKPKPMAVRYRIDTDFSATSFIGSREPEELLDLTLSSARNNSKVSEQAKEELNKLVKRSQRDVIQTKVLESELIDNQHDVEVELRQIAYSEWVARSGSGQYPATISVTHRRSDVDLRVTSSEALALWHYCSCRILGYMPTDIPTVYARRSRRYPPPSLEDISSYCTDFRITEDYVKRFYKRQTQLPELVSNYIFKSYCEELQKVETENRLSYMSFQSTTARAETQLINEAFWGSGCFPTVADDNYSQLLKRLMINEELLTDEFCLDLTSSIFYQATGIQLSLSNREGSVQKALIDLMGHLSSYDVQFIATSTYAYAVTVPRCDMKLEPMLTYISSDGIKIKLESLSILDSLSSVTETELISDFLNVKINSHLDTYERSFISTTVNVISHSDASFGRYVRMPTTKIIRVIDNV